MDDGLATTGPANPAIGQATDPAIDQAGVSRRGFIRTTAVSGLALGPIAAVLAACEGAGSQPDGEGGDSRRARTLRLPITSRIESPNLWNPMAPGMRDDAGFQCALTEPLFMLNYETGEVEPWLGEEFTANEALDVWTLKIRDGVTWSDGEAYDADDVVFTIELLRTGPAEINFAHAIEMQTWVASVRKIDQLTVEFTLTAPNPRFQLDYFSVKIFRNVTILPEHIWTGQDPLTFENYDPDQGWPVFTGPYTLASTSQNLVTYERNPDWWGAKAGFQELPAPEFLEFEAAETEEILVARASNNEFDFLDDITTGAYETMHARNEAMVSWDSEKPYSWADPCTRLFSFNTMVAPWDDRDMRWAVNFAVDKDEIVDIAYEGSTTKAAMFFPPYTLLEDYVQLLEDEGVFEEFPVLEHNPDKAAQLIESKGYTREGEGYYTRDGQELALQIDTPTEAAELSRYAEVIAEQLERIGIRTTLRRLQFPVFADNIKLGEFQAASDFSACGSVSEPWFSMDLFHERRVAPIGQAGGGGSTSTGGNGVRWANAEYSRHVDAMASLPLGDPGIDAHFVAACREYLRDLPFFAAAHAKKLYSHNTTYWSGWPTREDNYMHPPMVWTSSHRVIHQLQRA